MPIDSDYSGKPTYWKENLVVNGDAETGDTSSWGVSFASAVAIGQGGSSYCFLVGENGEMVQTIAPSENAKKYNAGVYCLPEFPPEMETERPSFFEFAVKCYYTSGGNDINISPCETIKEP